MCTDTQNLDSDPLITGDLAHAFTHINGRAVSYLVRAGTPTLVLIPGSHQDYRQYNAVLGSLPAALGVIIVELPGHRASRELPPDPSIERFAEDVLAVIRTRQLDSYYVGGHSIGGMIALEVGQRSPAGLRGIISIEGWTDSGAAEEGFGGSAFMYCTLSPELRAEQDRLRTQATGHRTAEERALLSGLWTRWSGMEFLQTTQLPVLELWGDRSRPRPTRAAMHVPDRANIQVRWFTNASHNLPLERPCEVAQATSDFIRRTEETR